MLRALAIAAVALLCAAPALAAEQIERFDVVIDVERDGDIVVTETIEVTAEGMQIRRGIFRDLPRYYESEGFKLPYAYDVLSVRRDGRDEPYDTDSEDNAFRLQIGDEDVLLEHGRHTYEIRYRVSNQVRYFDGYDEVYWNVTGNYWQLPIASARGAIVLPPGARITDVAGYTGARGVSGSDYAYRQNGDVHSFETTRPLQPREGLTIAVGFAKGLIDPPSSADRATLWWQRYGSLLVLLLTLGGLFWFLYRSWDRVGRDPPKGPVFPRYEAPEGYSPAGVHHIYYRGLSGHRALIATLMQLAVKGRLTIDATDKKNTVLTRAPGAEAEAGDVTPEGLALERGVFAGSATKTLGAKYDAGFTAAYTAFQQSLSRRYGSAYFKWNLVYTLGAVLATIVVIAVTANIAAQWTLWHTFGVLALAALNVTFLYFMPAATPKGQKVRTEIEGFRLYMETAEKLQLNAVEPGSEAPPPMTTERYETFLPYAVALGVEKPWTQHFERLLPQEAESYRPGWTNMRSGHTLGALTGAMVSNMSSGVASSMPQSSGSSGSGGGGSSGGGGGGGGGGGW